MIKKILSLSLLCSLYIPAVQAIDLTPSGLTIGLGSSIHLDNQKADLTAYRTSLVWDWDTPLVTFSSWQLGGYFDLALNYWKSNLGSSDIRSPGASEITAASFTPVFRLEPANTNGLSVFFDAGVGLSYLSDKDIQQEKQSSAINMGGRSQFEIRTMAGIQFGERQQYEIAYGWYHYSNAGIHDENEGVDFQLIHFGWRL
ncbi:acyloxyacyl hydrolase [Endozoicomonas sp. Mp262]|uniref:acyloxyacyl hydrolase n=1 Tax=Endozoicomonas sp. Mp262 TaxID=2919499 RepID=UPI0021D96BB9